MKTMLPCGSVAVLLSLACAACSSLTTSTDYDTNYDFRPLRTYSWMTQPPGTKSLDGLVAQRITKAVDADLAEKGYVKSESSPDFLVTAHAAEQGKVEIDGWGYGWWGGAYDTYHYTEGTLVLDLVDPKTKQMVWRGVAHEVVNPKATPEERTENVDEAVDAILESFPPGGVTPDSAAKSE